MLILGVDTGGTFTDLVLMSEGQVRVHKVLSTPAAPEKAILSGIAAMGLMPAVERGELIVVHGSTVATNAALEGKGVPTLYVCNRGFADVLTIARQNRSQLYSLCPPANPVPVPPEYCVEVGARTAADGSALAPLSVDDLAAINAALERLKPDAVAINLLFSFLSPADEITIAEHIGERAFVARSSAILPEYREYERGIATWISAWLGPVVAGYLNALNIALGTTPLTIMQSSGGTIDARGAAKSAVSLLLSGPAGGLTAALFVGKQINCSRLLTFDMGGTSTDVALIDGQISHTSEGHIGPYPVAVPMVDVHTIGAGGGSIAYLDAAGVLHVGPKSAGADPGPACYGKGGTQATVTDANLVLGHLPADSKLGGSMRLDMNAARRAVGEIADGLGVSIEEAASGIIRIANEHMAQALRVISVQRGYALDGFRLCSFGGAGGLHVCALADALQLDHALVPVHGGVLSALGLAVAPRSRTVSRSILKPFNQIDPIAIEASLNELATDAADAMTKGGVPRDRIEREDSLDLRYSGQSFTLNVRWSDKETVSNVFHQLHQQRFGHKHELELELVNARVELKASLHEATLGRAEYRPNDVDKCGAVHGIGDAVTIIDRNSLKLNAPLQGPALITEATATTLVAPGWQVCRDAFGNLLLDRNH